MKATVVMVVDVDVDNVKELGYSSIEEYLDDCTFEAHDAENNDIYSNVESYDYDDEYDDDFEDDDNFDDDDDFDDDFDDDENEEDEDFE